MQLFCFTHAGGSAAFFDKLEEACTPEIRLVKTEYPGHGSRRGEKPCSTLRELSRDLYKQIRKEYCGGDYALFGYSMGSVAAMETLRYLTDMGEMPSPMHIFLASHHPGIIDDLSKYDPDQADEYIRKRTVSFGGVPEKFAGSETFWRLSMPALRADYLMISGYDFETPEFVSDVPASLLYSEQDIPKEGIAKWERFFSGSCELVEYTGGHFFINVHYTEIAELIKEKLRVK